MLTAMEETHTVYIFRSSDGVLYVGLTKRPRVRIPQHRAKPWWSQVVSTETEVYPDKPSAEVRERQLILTLCPTYNVWGNPTAAQPTYGPRPKSGRPHGGGSPGLPQKYKR